MSQASPPRAETSAAPASPRNAWYRPVFSHDHGVYVMLFVSFLTGAAAAQNWTIATTLALTCAFCGFQAEHPIVLQIKQRRSWKPRFLFWGGLYLLIAGSIALYLWLNLWLSQGFQSGEIWSPLLVIFTGAIAAFTIDAISVLYREQKSIWNELITFAAVCLSAPFAYIVTTGTISPLAIGLWLLNTLFFTSAIFTVKFRKDKTHSLMPSLVYHTIAPVLLVGTVLLGWLSPWTIAAFAVALLKYALILWQRDWYCTTKIQRVALLETGSAMLFLAIVCLTLLPPRLPL